MGDEKVVIKMAHGGLLIVPVAQVQAVWEAPDIGVYAQIGGKEFKLNGSLRNACLAIFGFTPQVKEP
jgi:hypothetical protein